MGIKKFDVWFHMSHSQGRLHVYEVPEAAHIFSISGEIQMGIEVTELLMNILKEMEQISEPD